MKTVSDLITFNELMVFQMWHELIVYTIRMLMRSISDSV
jgi:hypothetical protein